MQEILAARKVLVHHFKQNDLEDHRSLSITATDWQLISKEIDHFLADSHSTDSQTTPKNTSAIVSLRDLKGSELRLFVIFSLPTKFQLAKCPFLWNL